MNEKKEYIERGALIDAIEGTDWYHIGVKGNLVDGAISDGNALYKADDVFEVLNKLPAADVSPVVHGEWINCINGNATCSVCGIRSKAVYDLDNKQHYCGHCGAKMDGGRP